jgi:hypothetical protein
MHELVESIRTRLEEVHVGDAFVKKVIGWVTKKLNDSEFKQFNFFFDHFETIGRKDWLTAPFAKLETWPQTFIATRRPPRQNDPVPPEWSIYEIGSTSDGEFTGPFTESDISEFLKRWGGVGERFKAHIANDADFARLMGYPYLLTLGCKLATTKGGWTYNPVYQAAKEMGVWRVAVPQRRGWSLARAFTVVTILVLAGAATLKTMWWRERDVIDNSGRTETLNQSPNPEDEGIQDVHEKDQFFIKDYYYPSGRMGDTGDVKIADTETTTQFIYTTEGNGPHEWEYRSNGLPAGFAGVRYLNPPDNWGTRYGGLDLRGFRYVSFDARSLGNEVNVRFSVGCVTWVWDDKTAQPVAAPYADRFCKEQSDHLTAKWKRITIPIDDLSPGQLQRVIGGFGWTIAWTQNGIQGRADGLPGQVKTFTIEIRDLICTKSNPKNKEASVESESN